MNQSTRGSLKGPLAFFLFIFTNACLWLAPTLIPAARAQTEIHPSLKRLERVLGPNDGVIRGKFVSAETGEALAAATVMALDPASGNVVRGVQAKLDGTYEMVVPAGAYTLKTSYISYAPKVVTGVKVTAGQPTQVDLSLTSEDIQGEEVVVEGRVLENTDTAVLITQQRAASVSDAVSAEQISRSADSDASDALKRVTGVSVVGGKYVYVRGLGERYSSTMLNGARMTSTEPSKRVVPLDMFPAKLLDNVVTQKTYTADQWAEFAGGVVQINTKDFPEELSLEFGQTVGVEPASNLRSFRSYPGGDYDFLGFDNGRRELPDLVRRVASDQKIVPRGRFGNTGFTPEELEALGESFENIWDPRAEKSGVNHGYNLSIGNQSQLLGRQLGYVGAVTYGGGADQRHEEQNSYTASDAGLIPYTQYQVDRSTQSVDWGALLNFTYRLTPEQSLSVRNTYTRNAEDEVRTYEGVTNENQDRPLRDQRLRYVERSMRATRFEGEHLVTPLARSILSWRLGRSWSSRDEPDNREVLYRLDPVTGQYQLYDVGESGQRFFSFMDDEESTAELSWSVPLPPSVLRAGKVSFGGFYSERQRDFSARRFRMVPKAEANNQNMDLTLPAELIFTDENIRPAGFQLEEKTRNTDAFGASHLIRGGHITGDLSLTSRLRLITGLRIESSDQRLSTFELGNPDLVPVVANNGGTHRAPTASLVIKTNEKTNVRVAASHTVNRPDFRELAPFEYSEFVGGRSEKGNPDLKDVSIVSYDVRWERYPDLGQVQALSIFYKDFDHPIEVLVQPGVSRTVTFTNSDGARNYGAEIELRQRLASLGEQLGISAGWLSGLNLGLNVTLVNSQVDVGQEGAQTSRERPLQGQSPFVVNGSLGYTTPNGRSGATFLYNVFGKRITEVGANGLPDVYERARHSIDLTGNTSLNGHVKVKLVAKNLLNHQHRFEQAGMVTEVYQTGRSYSIGLTYGL
jgi:hypothetical protein